MGFAPQQHCNWSIKHSKKEKSTRISLFTIFLLCFFANFSQWVDASSRNGLTHHSPKGTSIIYSLPYLPKAMLVGCNTDPVVSRHVKDNPVERGAGWRHKEKNRPSEAGFFFGPQQADASSTDGLTHHSPKDMLSTITNSGCAGGVQRWFLCEWACCPTLTVHNCQPDISNTS